MEVSMRSIISYYRLLKKSPRTFYFKRYCVSNTVPKEEPNSELLNTYNQDIKAGGVVPVFRRALLFPGRVALQDEDGVFTYSSLYQAANELSKDVAAQLKGETGRTIAYMCGNNASHVITQWAIWMSGNIAVPLSPIHPPEMLKYFISDSNSTLVICSKEHEKLLHPLAAESSIPMMISDREPRDEVPKSWKPDLGLAATGPPNMWYGESEAMLIYTSGTTSKPKGVVWTHNMLMTQISALHSAWQYSAHDVVLHTLPLHHIHGQLNSLNASLAAGARIRMLPQFASHTVWARLLGSGEKEEARVSVFHGVPAMYARLAADYTKMFTDSKTQEYVKSTLSKMRLMCAGSAPLPETLFNKYRVCACWSATISLDKLGLSSKNTKEAQSKCKEVRHGTGKDETSFEGELLLKGPNVFTRYWNRAPSIDSSDFTRDGWFRTGDIASYSGGKFRIMGRSSVDIIKTGGYKVSALQIESAILEHPSVADAAIIGVEDDSYGEIVGAVVVLKENTKLTLKELKDLAGKKLAPYQLPKTMVIVDTMPRNIMGKLDKKGKLLGINLIFIVPLLKEFRNYGENSDVLWEFFIN
ncbi:unnamed protein product, partial [Leptidea sinapis]